MSVGTPPVETFVGGVSEYELADLIVVDSLTVQQSMAQMGHLNGGGACVIMLFENGTPRHRMRLSVDRTVPAVGIGGS